MEPAVEGAEYVCPMDPEVRQDHPGACPKCGMALEPAAPARPTTTTTWTCPMHPEVVRDAPGACPICGMALEPRRSTRRGAEPRARRHDAPVLGLPAADRADPGRSWCRSCCPADPLATLAGHRLRIWIELALATPVVLWGGWPFFERGWASIVNRSLNMFTLIALGVGAAYRVQRGRRDRAGPLSRTRSAMGGEVAVYFEPAAVIVVLVLLGQVLELRARSRTGAAIRKLLGLAPPTARRIQRGRQRGRRAARAGARSATGCGSGPARRSRSTASCSRAPARSTSRW